MTYEHWWTPVKHSEREWDRLELIVVHHPLVLSAAHFCHCSHPAIVSQTNILNRYATPFPSSSQSKMVDCWFVALPMNLIRICLKVSRPSAEFLLFPYISCLPVSPSLIPLVSYSASTWAHLHCKCPRLRFAILVLWTAVHAGPSSSYPSLASSWYAMFPSFPATLILSTFDRNGLTQAIPVALAIIPGTLTPHNQLQISTTCTFLLRKAVMLRLAVAGFFQYASTSVLTL